MDSQDHDRWIGSDVGQQGCERIKFNEDYKDKQVDENGREYIDYWTCGGPCGGYMAPVYTDNDAVNFLAL